jgi:MoxR-like ATPase
MTVWKNAAMQSGGDVEAVRSLAEAREKIQSEIRKVIVGQAKVIDLLLVALFSRGHCLFVGVPGLAKTLLISTLSRVLNLGFSRIQFTPDLMPSDITGTEVLEEDRTTGKRLFKFIRGPVFTNLLLADEINRTPPKTQAALLQAMQEYRVTAAGETYPIPPPFLVFATQNPIEQEGTYPLPEAQLDRFMMHVDIDYPSEKEEVEIALRTTSPGQAELRNVLSAEEILALQELVLRVPVADSVADFAVRLARSSRPEEGAPEIVRKWVTWGAGPRASQALLLASKSKAILEGRYAASIEDIRELALPILKHRIILSFKAEAEGITTDQVVRELVESA